MDAMSVDVEYGVRQWPNDVTGILEPRPDGTALVTVTTDHATDRYAVRAADLDARVRELGGRSAENIAQAAREVPKLH